MDFFLSVSVTSIKGAVVFLKGADGITYTSKERADSFTLKGVGNFYPKEGWELDPNKGWKIFYPKKGWELYPNKGWEDKGPKEGGE